MYCAFHLSKTSLTKQFSGLNILIEMKVSKLSPGNTKGGSITVPLTSCLTGLESAV